MATTTGIVTAITSGGNDVWLQDPVGDGDPATSDGVFLSRGGALGALPGDMVTVTATVEEQQFGNALPLTRLANPSALVVESSGNPLPAPVPLTDLPDVSIPEGIEFWEPLEGMLVAARTGIVVAPTNDFGEFAFLTQSDARPGSGYVPAVKQILIRSLGSDQVDYNPERVLVDDFTLDDPIVVRPGDRVRSIEAVVDYSFGTYKLQPVDHDVDARPIPTGPQSRRSGGPGDTVVTTFNVENLFDLVDDPVKDDTDSTPTPEQLEVKFAKLVSAIEVELRLPEILVVEEVENTTILQELGDRVNASAGTDYVATSFETSDVRGIEVGFLWDASRVGLLEAFQLSGDDVQAAFGPSSASPGREPLVGRFSVGDMEVTIVGNHFKSKSGDDPLFGVNQPAIRVTEEQRKAQARAVRRYVDEVFDADPQALLMVAGDLNDFPFAEPGEGADHPVAIVEGIEGGSQLSNLVLREKPAERWTFVFEGNSQVLDHMLVSPSLLARFVAADILHINSSWPASLGLDPATPLHSADHDPVEGRFLLLR